MTKPIILKIVKRHKTLTPAMAFYSQHVSYELVDGRRRAIIMCNYLLESLTTTSAEGGQQGVTKLPVYDTKGLFLASTTQLFNEQCCQTKTKLEGVLKTIIKISRIKAKKDGKKCEVFDLINEWCNGGTLMSRSIGISLMNLYLPIELYDDKVQYLSQPLYDILCKAEKYIGELEEEKASPLSAYLLANILQLFKTLLELACVSGKTNVESTTKEFIFGNVVKSEKITNLLVHENVSVRSKTLEFFGQDVLLKLELLRNRNVFNEEYAHAKKKKKTKKIKTANIII
jgi:hypothetical protein